ncbi:MAG TPA: hypothetical protein VGP33_03665 [Chloroflexota bacterium]|nr:hypothetical protein [Chloroflexota bacterium]
MTAAENSRLPPLPPLPQSQSGLTAYQSRSTPGVRPTLDELGVVRLYWRMLREVLRQGA